MKLFFNIIRAIYARLFFIFLMVSFFSPDSFCQNSHIGFWKGVENGEIGYVKITENGFALFIIGSDSMGGEKFTVNGVDAKMTYRFDYNTKPIQVDFIVVRLDDNQEVGRLLGIVEFIGDTKIKIRFSFDNPERPIDFMPEGNSDTIILEKVE
jgi:hypothetical protein